MVFFDLNIPYSEASPSDKATRIKLATMAMELGYSGVAYNRTIKGIMSDRDRCSIPLPTLSSLLKLSPSLSSSVYFHRDLLGVPRASPFRQYKRLTVCADSPSHAQALNSGNPILKTYDLVSVRPLSQSVFDQACEKLEVDIIAIDFSEKLPFRLKLPMVKAAIQRGVYFEITYSNLIADVQARRQMIANAKLLVDWTRGKNLILSSAALTVYELRGPYDVANLSFLLGLSLERAKAAVSKNCRTLITKALRKKQFHKEAIKVEMISSGERVESDKPWSSDLFKWDPISSGEGDLLLEDLAKSFTASSDNAKAIDFTSIIGSLPSHGFQVNDLISGAEVASKSRDNSKTVNFVDKATALPVSRDGGLEQHSRLDIPKRVSEAPSKQEIFGNRNCQVLYSSGDTTKVLSDAVEIRGFPATIKAETSGPSQSTLNFIRTQTHDLQAQNCVNNSRLHVNLPNKNVIDNSDVVLDSARHVDSKEVTFTPSEVRDLHAVNEEYNLSSNLAPEAIGDLMDEDFTKQEATLPLNNFVLHEKFMEKEQLEEPGHDGLDPLVLTGQASSQESNAIRVEDNPSVAKCEPADGTTEDQKHGKTDAEYNHLKLAQSTPGKSKAKRRIPHQALLLPLKRRLGSSPFKKQPRKSKRKTKLV
ncbi:RNase P subunit p [Parasponia andersonii]|uniref:RNase P subunit p n=1 Tax=Parasponia andersonii TaxID=3476 RepID=A0A2P5A842_PARAD|nr:RNase P subunit p [Parasponia andersonii]